MDRGKLSVMQTGGDWDQTSDQLLSQLLVLEELNQCAAEVVQSEVSLCSPSGLCPRVDSIGNVNDY